MGKQSTNNNPPLKKSLIHRIKTEAATAAEDATEYMYGFSYRRIYNYTVHTYSTVRHRNLVGYSVASAPNREIPGF